MKTLIEKAKKDILQFKEDNPDIKITSFSELHDYFDANDYIKSLFNGKGGWLANLDEANLVLEELDNFIKQLNK